MQDLETRRRDTLRTEFQHWIEQKQSSPKAREILERMVGTVNDVPADVLNVYAETWEEDDNTGMEVHIELFDAIGNWDPGNATGYVLNFINSMLARTADA
jgi:hypothetical protein